MTLCSCINEFSPANEEDEVPSRQFPYGNDLTKYVKSKNAEKYDTQFSQNKEVTGSKAQSGSK